MPAWRETSFRRGSLVVSVVPMNTPILPSLGTLRGRIEFPRLESKALRGNRIGDPHVREVPTYVPPPTGQERYPVVFLLTGFTGRPHDFLETHPWRSGVIRDLDAAIARGDAPPAIVVMPDCWTRFGGSQYVNSALLGDYEDYIVTEVVPWIDDRYPTGVSRRAVVGKSSGGFGALHLAMRHPGVFPVAASISGDIGFEGSFGNELLVCLRGLIAFDGDPRAFLDDFFARPSLHGDRHAVINVLAMAACYSPNLTHPLGFDLPMDLRTGARVESVWQRWLEFDPLVACTKYADNLRGLEHLHLECGLRDEFHLQWGLRQLVDQLRALGVAFDHEEHDNGHRGISHRYLEVIPKLARVLGSC